MKTYKLVNNIVGWIVFAVAAFTYCSTIEPTASFWDCPEFISTAAKLEVGHPPGAPFFMLLGNLFSQFASDATQISKMVNTMSALLSAGCILFLFWSVTHLAKKLVTSEKVSNMFGLAAPETAADCEPTLGQTIAIMASGVAGALIYTWSDTFWFSAVEGEVYAFSSFLTALVFWLMLKWEQADSEGCSKSVCDRWLILIAYLMGLSIGVHLLNLLCIPAMVLIYYFRKTKEPTGKGSMLALGVSVIIIIAVLYGIVPGIGKVGGWFELLFVNQLGMSYNTGLYFYLVLLAASLIWAILETTKNTSRQRINISFLLCVALLGIPFYGYGAASIIIGVVALAVIGFCISHFKWITARGLNTTILCLTLIVVGYSSYAVIVIRSSANPMMDENSPEDVFSLEQYLGREQYGNRPLFFGKTFSSQPKIISDGNRLLYDTTKGKPIRQRKDKVDPSEKDEYVTIREDNELVYPSDQCMLFPRIYDEAHTEMYRQWLGDIHTKTVTYNVPGQPADQVQIPTQQDNIKFFLSYQMNFMYWRYFMWNFAGRQNDLQSTGELEHGNWLSGFEWLDDMRLGDQDLLPTELRENKGHNVFYCLPLLLGLIGFFWQAFRGKRGIQQFWVVFFLFFMTGIAIVLYLNQTPGQPRERDYAYAGSFYAFSMWCGLGITAIYVWLENLLGKKMNQRIAAILASAISFVPALAVPLQMVSQTWDDHDRSDRYMCRDFGLNYLETIPEDGIIFTNGDNDTFPLWYNEDTEGNRTDVRVCNLSYLQTDWYIDQMKRPAFSKEQGQSSPLPITWKRYQYTSGKNEGIEVNPTVQVSSEGSISMKELVKMMYEQSPKEARAIWGDEPFELKNAIKKFVLKEDIPAEYAELVNTLKPCLPSDSLYINVDKEAVRRSGMMIPGDSIPDRMVISLKGQPTIYKNFMMILEMLANSNFSRPIYMSCTVGPSNFGNLYYHFVQEGLAWRITPFTFGDNDVYAQTMVCDPDKMYDNLMNKYHYGNLSQKGLYIDETVMRMCWTHRRCFAYTITQLLNEKKMDKAKKALDKCAKEIPEYNVPYDAGNGALELAQAYMAVKQYDNAEHIYNALEMKSYEYLRYYESLPNNRFASQWRYIRGELGTLLSIQEAYNRVASEGEAGSHAAKYKQKADKMLDELNAVYTRVAQRAASLGINL